MRVAVVTHWLCLENYHFLLLIRCSDAVGLKLSSIATVTRVGTVCTEGSPIEKGRIWTEFGVFTYKETVVLSELCQEWSRLPALMFFCTSACLWAGSGSGSGSVRSLPKHVDLIQFWVVSLTFIKNSDCFNTGSLLISLLFSLRSTLWHSVTGITK